MEGHVDEVQLHTSRIAKIDSLATWDLFVAQGNPIVVHFTASWCMPSVAMNPLFEELALSYPEVQFLIVDVDEVKVATRLDVKAMPTFLVMKEGKQVDKVVGANPEERYGKGSMDTFKTYIHMLPSTACYRVGIFPSSTCLK